MRSDERTKILFVFAWLVVGGEETEVCLLAQHLNPQRYSLDVVACFRKPNMPDQTHVQLEALGVVVDRAPYDLSLEDTAAYLADKILDYDIVVACQAVPDVYLAYELLQKQGYRPPPLIEHGGLVSEALAGPKQFTSRYVGVCRSIRDAAASVMLERPHHALEIPSMVDLSRFDHGMRKSKREAWGLSEDSPAVGWVGRLDRKKRVEDFIRAAAMVRDQQPETQFFVMGGPDAFMPEYAGELVSLAGALGLENSMRFLGDRADIPELLIMLDVFVWLSRNEGMPHVIAEAGAAGLPVVATRDNGSEQQIVDGVSGLFVPHESPLDVAGAVLGLIRDRELRHELGRNLRRQVEAEYSAEVVTGRWEFLFDELVTSGSGPQRS